MAIYEKKKTWQDKKDNKSKFRYIPAMPPAPFDTRFHEKNADGTYNYKADFKLVESIEDLKKFRDKVKGLRIAYDSETTGLAYFNDFIVGFSLSIDDMSGIYIPIRHQIKQLKDSVKVDKLDKDGNIMYTAAGKPRKQTVKEYEYYDDPSNLDPKETLDVLYDILTNASLTLCHNAEFDMIMLQAEGYNVRNITFFDTMTLTYLIDAEANGIAGLKPAEKHYLGRYRADFKEVLGKEEDFRYVSPKDAYFYAACDTCSTYALFTKLYPIVKKLIQDSKETIVLDGKRYDVLKKDNKLIKCWIDYYAHAQLYVDRNIAIQYKESVIESLIKLTKEIYDYFKLGTFNLSTSSGDFKNAMLHKHIVTGHLTDTGNPSYGKDGIKVYNKNLNDLKVIIDNNKNINFSMSSVDLRKDLMSLSLSKVLVTYGNDYFQVIPTLNNIKLLSKSGEMLTRRMFVALLKAMHKKETEKINMLRKIQKNSSLNKAVNSYIEKLANVDTCKMRYKLFGTKSGRLASGNGSKSDKKTKNTYYIDLNAQNLTKPKSAMYRAYESDEADNIMGWKFELVSDEYAKEHKDTDYMVEGASPELNIRNAIVTPPMVKTVDNPDPKPKYMLSLDYSAQEYLMLALLSKDSKMIKNFKDGIDPHTAITWAIWGKENYNKELRKKGKGANFAINYGGNEYTIHKNLEIPLEEAKFIMQRYQEEFFECIQWKNNLISKTFRNGGTIHTIFGRPRKLGSYIKVADSLRLEDEKAYNGLVNAAARRVISHAIQGACGDICRYVLIKLYDKYFKQRDPDLEFMSVIHDEVNFLVTQSETLRYARDLEDLMTFNLPGAPLPITTSIDIGLRWGQMFPFVFTDESRTKLVPKRAH